MSGEEEVAPYPLAVVYCGICGVPPEYCPYGPEWERCRVWIETNHPDLMPAEARSGQPVPKAVAPPSDAPKAEGAEGEDGAAGGAGAEESGSEGEEAAASGKAAKSRRKKKTCAIPDPSKAEIIVTVAQRKKHKFTTTIAGVESFGLKIKDVAKKLGKRMATGAGIITNEATEGEEIELQGDFSANIAPVLTELFEIPGNKIFKQQGTRKIRLGEDSGVVFTGGAGGSGSSAPAPASSGPAGGAGKPKGKGKAAAAPGSDDEGAVAKGFDDDVELVKSTVAADDI